MRTLTITVSGMHCASCGLLIDDALLDLEGVRDARTDTRTGVCSVVVDDHVADADVLEAITDVGYAGVIASPASSDISRG